MYKEFNYLCDDAKKIRNEVFIKEQHFMDEYDEFDNYATHLVFYSDLAPIATCRFYKGANEFEYIVGRIAVMKEYRGNHRGEIMMNVIEELIYKAGGHKISLSAQVRVQPFYEKLGYVARGPHYFDEYCEHVHMEKYIDL